MSPANSFLVKCIEYYCLGKNWDERLKSFDVSIMLFASIVILILHYQTYCPLISDHKPVYHHYHSLSNFLCEWRQYANKLITGSVICDGERKSYGYFAYFIRYFEGILPKGPYLPCVSMAGRVLLAGYPRFVFRIVRSLWNLTDTSAALVPIFLSNFKAMQ